MAPTLTRRRRRKPGDGRALTAAAMRMPLESKSQLRKVFRKPDEWQTEAWEFFDVTPEVKFVTWWVGNLMSKVKFYAAVEDEDGEAIAIDAFTEDENGTRQWVMADVPDSVRVQAVAEVDRLRFKSGGRGQLLKDIAMNHDVAGDCWLVGFGARPAVIDPDPTKARPATPERWEIRSISEVELKAGVVTITSAPASKDKIELDPAYDTWIRLYQRHPRWRDVADAHTKGILSQCRMLQVLEGEIMAESMSRHNAGIILVKQGTKWAPSADGSDAEDEEVGLAEGITELVTEPVADIGHPSSVVPNIAEVENINEAMKWQELGRTPNEVTDKRIDKRIDRIAAGLNAPKEVVLGHRSTTFANAQQIGEDEFVDHLEPRILLALDSLTEGFLKWQLIDAGGESAAWAERVFLWYDATALMDPPDLSEAADEALRNMAITFKAYRAAKGFTEDDAPTPEEQLQMLGLFRSILTAELSQSLLQKLDPEFGATAIDDTAAATTDEGEMAALVAACGGPSMVRLILMQALSLTPRHVPPAAIDTTAQPALEPPPRPR